MQALRLVMRRKGIVASRASRFVANLRPRKPSPFRRGIIPMADSL
jgi:hypothetical protein